MPQYAFECECGLQFRRSLKMGEHSFYSCPNCSKDAPRYFEGEGFGFAFANTKANGNTGVSKHDYPTADQAVGSSAEARWKTLKDRDDVKKKVREVGGTHALVRRAGPDYVEYEAGGKPVVDQRKKLMEEVRKTEER